MAPEGTISLVILGANGDLARRKLLPALFSLYCKGRLPERFRVIGSSRTKFTDETYRDSVRDGVGSESGQAQRMAQDYEAFAKKIEYVVADVSNPESFAELRGRILEGERDAQPANRIFYLAVAPQLYRASIEALEEVSVTAEDTGWRRVVVEKPFGWDLASAKDLNDAVHRVFPEHQVYRIDHYLGKETVQNLMVLRFANSIFEPVWSRHHIKNVQITVAESVDVADRGGYYDKSGVIRDMVQNHLMQLLTVVAMEPPVAADAESLRNRKVDVLKSIRRPDPRRRPRDVVAGQYDGYRQARGVDPESKTATYAALRLFIDNWRWRGVPFYLRTGKSLKQKVSEIVIEFQTPPQTLFSAASSTLGLAARSVLPPNILAICIQPDEGAHLRFQAKIPDREMQTRSVDMEFHYASAFSGVGIPEAYERLLQDAIQGDPSLFIRSDQIEEAWRVVDPVTEAWEADDAQPPVVYARGSEGPTEADVLLAEFGDRWNRGCGPAAELAPGMHAVVH